ncbi:MAG: exosortase C-terminal domain/associated protein EpsI [Janthinobacterium lividum]
MWPRYALVFAMMAGTASMLFLRSSTDRVPDSVPLELLPHQIEDRHAVDIPIAPVTLELLGHGHFLNRVYADRLDTGASTAAVAATATSAAARQAAIPISLFIGYFPTQRTGQAIHSPQNCLPGAGWTFESARTVMLPAADGKLYQVGEYVITDGTQKQEVLYWYRAHGRSIASDYRAKLYMLVDALRYNRTDGALVRVITPMLPGEPDKAAHLRAADFAGQVAAMLPAYIPD